MMSSILLCDCYSQGMSNLSTTLAQWSDLAGTGVHHGLIDYCLSKLVKIALSMYPPQLKLI